MLKRTRISITLSLLFTSSLLPVYAQKCTSTQNENGKYDLVCSDSIYTYEAYEKWNHDNRDVSDYDHITLTTKEAAATSPQIAGWGIYGNNSRYDIEGLDITTTGGQADAIVAKNGTNIISVNNLTIKTTGSSADGINLAKESYKSTVSIGDNLYVDAQGMGVRSNTSENSENENLLTIGKNATIISRGDGINRDEGKVWIITIPSEGDGYTVYAGNAITKGRGQARVVIGDNSNLTSYGKDAHVVFANRSGVIELGSTTINAKGQNSHGIYAETGKKLINGVSSDAGGEVYLMGDTTITSVGSGKYAIYAKGKDSFVTSSNRTTGERVASIYTIDGNLRADTQGLIDLKMIEGTRFTGNSSVDSAGVINLDISGTSSNWNMTDSSSMTNLTLTGATLNFIEPVDVDDSNAFIPKTLTVKGNYVGNNGTLVLNTVLGDDGSKSDKLVIEGDSSGETLVQIRNIGGIGAQTINGIEIITVAGLSNGEFKESGRITAGAYDYFVRRSKLNDKNWVLISDLTEIRPEQPEQPEEKPEQPEVKPEQPEEKPEQPEEKPEQPEEKPEQPEEKPEQPEVKPEQPEVKPDPIQPPSRAPYIPVIRPEAGSYATNMYMAANIFNLRLHDRVGEMYYKDVITGELIESKLWGRIVGGRTDIKSGDEQLQSKINHYMLQLGGDLYRWNDDESIFSFGLMGGLSHFSSKTLNQYTSYRSDSNTNGYSLGIYGTYFADKEEDKGLYVDGWLQYNWFRSTIDGMQLANEKYRLSGWNASLEFGYTVPLNEEKHKNSGDTKWSLQPKAQVIYQGVKMKNHREVNGTYVEGYGEGNIQTRLGLKLIGKPAVSTENYYHFSKDNQFFLELNWIHNSKTLGAKLDGVKINNLGTENIGEIKIGYEGRVSRDMRVWFNVAHQRGSHGYKDTRGMAGIRYLF